MPFSILLLTSASSKTHITGASSDRVSMKRNELESDELVLFFDKVDEGPARKALGMDDKKCCDGIIFYKNNSQNIICLVEMKHTDLGEAKEQIKETYDRLHALLKQECKSCGDYLKKIIWQAYIYRSGAAPKGGYRDYENNLKEHGFKEAWIRGDRDITKYLRMEIEAGKNKKSRS